MPSQSHLRRRLHYQSGVASFLGVIVMVALAVGVIVSGQLVSRQKTFETSQAATPTPSANPNLYGMSHTFVKKGAEASKTLSWTHSGPTSIPVPFAGYSRMVLVTAAYEYGALGTNSITSVTYCGSQLTLATQRAFQANDYRGVGMWYLKNPPLGSCPVVVTFSDNGIFKRYILSATHFASVPTDNPVVSARTKFNTTVNANVASKMDDISTGPLNSISSCVFDALRTSTQTITPLNLQQWADEFTETTMGGNYIASALGLSTVRTVEGQSKTVQWNSNKTNVWSMACANVKIHPSLTATPPSSSTPIPTPTSTPTPTRTPTPTPSPTPNCSVYLPLPSPANVKVGGLTGNPINISSGARTITWDAVPGAVRYQVIVNNKEDSVGFANSNCASQYPLDKCANGLLTPSYTYSSFLANRHYQVEVRAINSCGYTGNATLKEVTVGTLIPPTNGLTGNYYPTTNFTTIQSLPNFVRRDRPLDIYWDNNAAPLLGFPKDFSIEWTGKIQTQVAGSYKFELVADDSATVYWNSPYPLYGDATKGVPKIFTIPNLQANTKYPIKIRYKNSAYEGQIRLFWTPPGGTKQIVPASKLFPQ